MAKKYNTIRLNKKLQTGWLTLNRPNKLNAINKEMLQEISEAIDYLQKNPKIRCIIITGAGKRAFSTGADINEMQELTKRTAAKFSTKGQHVFSKIEALSKPVIAAINGYCLGGGLELALACDFRYSSDNAEFGFPEMKLGIVPAWGGSQRLPLAIGITKAKRMILLGETVEAQEASEIGLVDKVIPLNKLQEKSEQMAQKICRWPPEALRHAKQTVNLINKEHLKQGFAMETKRFAQLFHTKETKEHIEAFWNRKNENREMEKQE